MSARLGIGVAAVDDERQAGRARRRGMRRGTTGPGARAGCARSRSRARSRRCRRLSGAAPARRDAAASTSGSAAASCGWIPTEHQMSGSASAMARTVANSPSLVPMVSIVPTPARLARAMISGALLGRGEIEVAMAVDQEGRVRRRGHAWAWPKNWRILCRMTAAKPIFCNSSRSSGDRFSVSMFAVMRAAWISLSRRMSAG